MFNRLYIHIPFCVEKCGYCAFVSAKPWPGEIESYHELLLQEMRLAAADHESGQPLDSIYFGGGTPSLMQPRQVSRIIDLAAELFSLSPRAEITLEANPGTIDRERLQNFREAGVNRLSLGVQSFDDVLLRRLGRVHDAAQARHAFREARLAGFGNIGIDLIHGLPGQTFSGWREELREALALSPEHISVYGLTVEEGTPFALRYPEESPEIPDDDRSAEMFETADTVLVEAGFEHYEIANYATDGYRSRHNSGYWRRDGYLGLGVAAHSLLRREHGYRFSNHDTLEEYGRELAAGRLPRRDQHQLNREDALAEFMFLGLRLAEGVLADDFEREFGSPLRSVYGTVLDELLRIGLLQQELGALRLTRRGLLLSNQVFARFLP
ncbi:MAG: radical SAM family heme chaperone HemW [Deltaproteobacteria bacterium]|nr:radical SAM family heme chaperone HemW [Deltaproteobacteria bacterium]